MRERDDGSEQQYDDAVVSALFDVLEHALARGERETAADVAAQVTELVTAAHGDLRRSIAAKGGHTERRGEPESTS